MGKRYFCDYCERTFPDTADNRKKHLQGVHHQKLKKIHYDSFKGAESILREEMAKNPCRKFNQTGSCEFGPTCRYSHLTTADFQYLQEQAWIEKQPRSLPPPPNLNEWLENREKRKKLTRKDTENPYGDLLASVSYHLPPELTSVPNVPPSLVPFKPSELLSGKFEQWG